MDPWRSAWAGLFLMIFLVIAPWKTWALSDTDYRAYHQSSAAFREAETRLNELWKRLMAHLPAPARDEIVQNQALWVRKGREDRARELAGHRKLAPAEAYALATQERADQIEARLKSLFTNLGIFGKYSSGMGRLIVRETQRGQVEFDLTTDWPPQNCSGRLTWTTSNVQGNQVAFADQECPRLILNFYSDRVEATEEGHCGYHGLNCNFEGTYERMP